MNTAPPRPILPEDASEFCDDLASMRYATELASMRYSDARAFGIVKKAGVIIRPIQYEEVDPHSHTKPDEPRRIVQKANTKPKAKKSKAGGQTYKNGIREK